MAIPGTNLKEFLERVKLLDKIYEDIRFVDPVNKQVIPIKTELQSQYSSCFAYWEKGVPCDNCISMRAYLGNNTFFKLDHKSGKGHYDNRHPCHPAGPYLNYGVIKDVTHNMVFESDAAENDDQIESLMTHMNSLAVRDSLTGTKCATKLEIPKKPKRTRQGAFKI